MILRPYQTDIIQRVEADIANNNTALALMCPTGSGKTIMAQRIMHDLEKQGKISMFVMGRKKLLVQSFKNGYSIMASQYPNAFDINKKIHIAMWQTLYRRRDIIEKIGFKPDVIFCDEVHEYATGNAIKWMKSNCIKFIGVSATPITIKQALIPGLENIIGEEYQTKYMIEQNYLSPYRYLDPDTYNNELQKELLKLTVKSTGDFNEKDLENLTIDYDKFEKVLNDYKMHAADRKKTLFFCSTVKQAEAICTYFKNHSGKKCFVISYNVRQDVIDEAYKQFEAGELDILFNVGMCIAGIDIPAVDCIVLYCPTKSLSGYIQRCGRGLRLHPGKKDCLIMDYGALKINFGKPDDLRYYEPYQPREKKIYTDKECPECGYYVPISTKICPFCKYQFGFDEGLRFISDKQKIKYEKMVETKSLQELFYDRLVTFMALRNKVNPQEDAANWLKQILKTKKRQTGFKTFYISKIKKLNKIVQNNLPTWHLKY